MVSGQRGGGARAWQARLEYMGLGTEAGVRREKQAQTGLPLHLFIGHPRGLAQQVTPSPPDPTPGPALLQVPQIDSPNLAELH